MILYLKSAFLSLPSCFLIHVFQNQSISIIFQSPFHRTVSNFSTPPSLFFWPMMRDLNKSTWCILNGNENSFGNWCHRIKAWSLTFKALLTNDWLMGSIMGSFISSNYSLVPFAHQVFNVIKLCDRASLMFGQGKFWELEDNYIDQLMGWYFGISTEY